jgi:ferredoxin
MRVIADWDLCESNGMCQGAAPEMFHLDDKDELNIAHDGEVPPELAGKVREAVRVCPKMALSIEES